MKAKITSIMIALLLVLSSLPMAFAEDTTESETTDTTVAIPEVTSTTEITSEDEKQIKDLEVPAGAQLRFLQLQRSIMKNIFVGEQTIGILQKNHADKDFTSLISINNEFKAVLEKVKTANFEGKDHKTIAQDFVALKKSSIDITKRFREEAKTVLTTKDFEQIKLAIKENKDEVKAIDEQIKTARKELNAKRVEGVLKRMGIENTELVQKVKDGTATKEEVVTATKEALKSMIKEKKVELVKEMKSNQVKREAVKEQIKNEMKKYKEEVKNKIKEQKGKDKKNKNNEQEVEDSTEQQEGDDNE